MPLCESIDSVHKIYTLIAHTEMLLSPYAKSYLRGRPENQVLAAELLIPPEMFAEAKGDGWSTGQRLRKSSTCLWSSNTGSA